MSGTDEPQGPRRVGITWPGAWQARPLEAVYPIVYLGSRHAMPKDRATVLVHIPFTCCTNWSSTVPHPSWKPISSCFLRSSGFPWMARAT